MVRSVLSLLGFLLGVLGSLVFVVAVLALVATPAASGVPVSCAAPSGSLFSPCAALDLSRVDDLR